VLQIAPIGTGLATCTTGAALAFGGDVALGVIVAGVGVAVVGSGRQAAMTISGVGIALVGGGLVVRGGGSGALLATTIIGLGLAAVGTGLALIVAGFRLLRRRSVR
jgi:hypothetical protein